MLHVEFDEIKALLFRGNFGLEEESLRVTADGHMAHTPHPFPEDWHIARDFCENQIEINTPVLPTARDAVDSLFRDICRVQKWLSEQPRQEYLWPFSSPPYILSEEDIPIARFTGEKAPQTAYREYLADRYGRYKMTFSGIHVNYSFSIDLLRADFARSGQEDFTEYKNNLYLHLARQLAVYGWVLTAVTAASPLLDSSFADPGNPGKDLFNGMASYRCSELGYWNRFTPTFDYSDIRSFAESIRGYVESGLITAPRELYYPIRLKPKGKNDLGRLLKDGVDHIELRMFDLNPLCPAGIDLRDLEFAQLLICYLAATPGQTLSERDQIQAAQNFKNAAHYDPDTTRIVLPGGAAFSAGEAAGRLIAAMQAFYADFSAEAQAVLAFQAEKFRDPQCRYARKVRDRFCDGFVEKGMALAKENQENAKKLYE